MPPMVVSGVDATGPDMVQGHAGSACRPGL